MGICAILSAPLASAAQGTGAFTAEGPIVVPAGARFNFTVGGLALLADDSLPGDGFVLQADHVTVHHFKRRFLGAPPAAVVRTETEERTWDLTGVTVTSISHSDFSFLGVHAGPGATLSGVSESETTLHPRTRSTLSTDRETVNPRRDYPSYHAEVSEPHLFASLSGSAVLHGAGEARVLGSRVRIVASENQTDWDTGYSQPSAVELMAEWFIFSFGSGRVEIQTTREPLQITASAANSGWDGKVTFRPLLGALETREATYVPSASKSEKLDGTFQATLEPALDGKGVAMRLHGDLRGTSLVARPVPLGARLSESPAWGFVLLGVAAVVGAGATGTLWWWRHGHRARPPDPLLPFRVEDCVEAGAIACAEEDWARGAEWYRRAHELAPTSARVAADLAFALTQIGGTDEAMAYFRRAHDLSTDGEAAFNAALAALAAGYPPEEVEQWLRMALTRTPSFVATLDDREWDDLRRRPSVRQLEAWARAQATREDPDGSRGGWREGDDPEP